MFSWQRAVRMLLMVTTIMVAWLSCIRILWYEGLLHALMDMSSTLEIQQQQEPDFRWQRFPTREQRMMIYMSSWYLPPHSSSHCESHDAGPRFHFQWTPDDTTNSSNSSSIGRVGRGVDPSLYAPSHHANRSSVMVMSANPYPSSIQQFRFDRYVDADVAFLVEPGTMEGCAKTYDKPPLKRPRPGLLKYCQDVVKSVLPLQREMAIQQEIPLIFQFGCNPTSKKHGELRIPHFRKFRQALPANALGSIRDASNGVADPCATMSQFSRILAPLGHPLLWLLNSDRFRGPLRNVAEADIPWSRKKNRAVWRGSLTGTRDAQLTKVPENASAVEKCFRLPRCRLVYQAAQQEPSTAGTRRNALVDTKLTALDVLGKSGVTAQMNGVSLVGPPMTMEEQLQHKALIVLEGHEVASALLWSLHSQSVVLMAPPRYTTWSMEEMLVPWIHYVPLDPELNYDNVEDMVQWVLDNEDGAQKISARASLWVYDLMFHPDAASDDEWIQRELIDRYSVYYDESRNELQHPQEAD
ncbi:lipopolysaccharide core biosynthesis protein [Seminavis robusta]|uniref:Lipopolysaccharide core biosynthesis protein n=1 Tax=Seminavis robusta TaxID=568900 RepID=A0A9N8ES64_9STRA|nr:lipopolysaccharide core biosynthesis protein [Seminavis robusta]|eukprot:Sro1949_g307280.1 lipopolysaccharide core biosynthesis protein (525) ;mRNA; r:5782-7356